MIFRDSNHEKTAQAPLSVNQGRKINHQINIHFDICPITIVTFHRDFEEVNTVKRCSIYFSVKTVGYIEILRLPSNLKVIISFS